MSYTDNAPLITAWDTRVQALKDIIATLYDGSTTKVVIEDTLDANVLLSSVDGLTLDSNEQAPSITLEAPALVVEPSEDEVTDEDTDQGTDEVTDEDTDDGVDQEQEETAEDSVEENTDEVTEEDENS